MPKLKRERSEERATDFVESLDRGLRLLQTFGATSGPMTLSDIAARRRPAARHRAPHPVHAGARRLCRQRRQAVHAHAARADAGGVLSALEPGGDGAAAGAGPDRDDSAGDQLARGARRRRGRVHRARQPGAGVFRRARYRLPPAGLLHLGRPRHARPVRRCRARATPERDAARGDDAAHRDRPEALLADHHRRSRTRAIRWSTARPSRISVRSRCRCAATTARSSPPSTWAPMSIASRRRDGRAFPAVAAGRRGGGERPICCERVLCPKPRRRAAQAERARLVLQHRRHRADTAARLPHPR